MRNGCGHARPDRFALKNELGDGGCDGVAWRNGLGGARPGHFLSRNNFGERVETHFLQLLACA
jgi:hypothetical protein